MRRGVAQTEGRDRGKSPNHDTVVPGEARPLRARFAWRRLRVTIRAVLDAREQSPGSTLADLYDPLTMPPVLAKAHAALDRTVDRLYRPEPFEADSDRVALLFERYGALV